jgi:hypothetical protein
MMNIRPVKYHSRLRPIPHANAPVDENEKRRNNWQYSTTGLSDGWQIRPRGFPFAGLSHPIGKAVATIPLKIGNKEIDKLIVSWPVE